MSWRVGKILRTSQMININVALPNGDAELLTLMPSSTVQDLRTKAQRAFGKKCLRLITARNRVLVDFEQTLEESEIKDGECLTALALKPQLAATRRAFALWCHGDGTIVNWGDEDCGGDSSAVQDQLKGVQQITATHTAFAASLADGSVVTWGGEHYGGDSSAVRDQLKAVQQIQATNFAFAAILADGSVVTWGDELCGGDMRWQFGSSRSAQRRGADSSHKCRLCCDSGRWIRRYLGSWILWWWQFGSSRSAQRRGADSSHKCRLSCDSGRWIRRYLGRWNLWQRQFGSSRSAQRRGADSSHKCRLCCDSGRWIRRYLGSWILWWWQFGSSRSAQGCAADSGHSWRGLCCDSGRWIRRYWGERRVRRWQFSSSAWTQVCLVESSCLCRLAGPELLCRNWLELLLGGDFFPDALVENKSKYFGSLFSSIPSVKEITLLTTYCKKRVTALQSLYSPVIFVDVLVVGRPPNHLSVNGCL